MLRITRPSAQEHNIKVDKRRLLSGKGSRSRAPGSNGGRSRRHSRRDGNGFPSPIATPPSTSTHSFHYYGQDPMTCFLLTAFLWLFSYVSRTDNLLTHFSAHSRSPQHSRMILRRKTGGGDTCTSAGRVTANLLLSFLTLAPTPTFAGGHSRPNEQAVLPLQPELFNPTPEPPAPAEHVFVSRPSSLIYSPAAGLQTLVY